MKKSLIALSTLSVLLIANTASAAITWPVEQTYEESLNAELTTTKCENSSLQRDFRRVYKINSDGSKTFVNTGNGIYLNNIGVGDGYEILSGCYDMKDVVAESSKIKSIENDVITQKCPDPTDTGLITKRRQYTSYNPDRVNSNYKIDFRITVNYACQQKLFAETVTENSDATCPTGYAGQITNSRTYDLYTDGTKDNYSAWVKIVDTCKVIESKTETKIVENPNCATKNPAYPLGTIAETWTRTIKNGVASEWASNPFYPVTNKCYKTVTETKNPTCPTGFTGQITQSRTYDLWKTGSTKNDSGFITTQDTCSKTENKQLVQENCATVNPNYPLGTTNGLYSRTLTPAGIASDWKLTVLISNSCYYMKDTVTSTNEVSCPTGQTGKIIREQHLKIKQFISYSQNDSSYIVETENSCKASGPVTVEVKPGSETVSCDSYYGVQQGTYTGNVTKTGDNLTIFDPVSGATNTTFQPKSVDTTSCVKEITTTTKELIEENCPAGFDGKITKYLIKAENAQGTVYPYGTTPILESNTCVAVSTTVETPAEPTKHLQDTVLSNLSFTTTSISKSDLIINELNKINTSKLESKGYVMNINADDLSANAFDKNKITNLVKTFKTKLGTDSAKVKLASVPVILDKYIGQDGLTQSRIAKEKLALSSTSIDGGTVTVKYVSLAKATPQHFSFTVKVFE